MPDYGLPPVNGAPGRVNRKNFYGATDDRTIQDVLNLNATITHAFTPKIDAAQPDAILALLDRCARVGAEQRRHRSRDRRLYGVPGDQPRPTPPRCRSTSLFVGTRQSRPGHHRHVALQPDRPDHRIPDRPGPASADRRIGARPGHQQHAELLAQHPGQSEQLFRVLSRWSTRPTSRRADLPSVAGNLVQASATDVAPYVNDTMSFANYWKVVAGVRYDRYNASLTNSISLPPSASQSVGFTSVRAGVIFQPTDTQSYYVSYGTSFNPSLETLALTNGQQSLDPETSTQYELGGKWDVLDGNLSLTAAIFQIEKDNTRSQISPGRLRAHRRHARARASRRPPPAASRAIWQVFGGYTFLDAEIVKASALDGTRGQGAGEHAAEQRVDLDHVQPHARMAGRHRGCLHVGPLHFEHQRGQGAATIFAGTRWSATRQPKYGIQLNVFNLTNRLNYDALIPSDRGRSVPGTDLAGAC